MRVRDYNFSSYSSAPILVSSTTAPTTGGQITISGSSFGPTGTSVCVLIAGQTCSDGSVTAHTTITCTVSAGTGSDQVVEVTIPCPGGQTSSKTIFSYSGLCVSTFFFSLVAPSITSVTSAPTQGGSVTITGLNFGPSSSGMSVLLDDTECAITQFIPHTSLLEDFLKLMNN